MFVFSVFRLISRRCHTISSIPGCPSAPPRTVLALFTHTLSFTRCHNLRAMRCNFVDTASLRLGAAGVSSHRSALCHLLSSSGITRLRWYYETIRLPMSDKLRLSNYGCWSPLPSMEANIGSPGLPCCRCVMHAMVSGPGRRRSKATIAPPVLTSASLCTLDTSLCPMAHWGLNAFPNKEILP